MSSLFRTLPSLLALVGALLLSGTDAWAAKPKAHRRAPVQRGRAEALIAEGKSSLQRKALSAAIAAFQGAAEADPGSAEAFLQLGNSYYERGFSRGTPDRADTKDVQRALDAYQNALALDPEHKAVSEPFLLHHGMAQCYQALGRYDQAAESLRLASLAAKHNPMPLLYTAELRYKMRDLKQSSESLLESVHRARRIKAYRSLAKLVRTHPQFAGLLQVPQNKMILETYDAVEEGKVREDHAKEVVEERLSMRDALNSMNTSESRSRLLVAPTPDPRMQEWLEEADGDFKYQKFRRAAVEYQQVLKLDATRGSLGAAERGRILQHIGVCYRKLGLTAEAIQYLEKSAQEMPDVYSTYYQLALAHSTAGQFTSALHALELSLQHARSNSDLRMTLLLAKTDTELEPLRDLPGYQRLLVQYSPRVQPARSAHRR
ncbi:MAG: tetratricopeptide repeat protein [Elusimicrobia bacterium]|nr:tetratricopeptide repeat protein [Elusimicrobiota bacterium]